MAPAGHDGLRLRSDAAADPRVCRQPLAAPPRRSSGSIELGGRTLEYKVEGAFIPVLDGSQTDRRGEPQAAVFTTAYQLERQPDDTAPRDPGQLAALTPREREMVAEVATGRSNEEIAARMFLSPFTVRAHVQRAMTKLEARDRAQLVVIAYRAGLAPGLPPP